MLTAAAILGPYGTASKELSSVSVKTAILTRARHSNSETWLGSKFRWYKVFQACGQVAEWLMAADCKSAARRAT
jgi:hypothetical protein